MRKLIILSVALCACAFMKAQTTTTTSFYYGQRAGSNGNPCEGECEAVCKKVVVQTTPLTDKSTHVTETQISPLEGKQWTKQSIVNRPWQAVVNNIKLLALLQGGKVYVKSGQDGSTNDDDADE